METESFLNVGEVASLLGARLSGGPKKQALSGVFTDTRTPKPKALFIALRGENFNGNLYAEQALRLGAAAVMADDHEVAEKLGRTVKQPVLTVPNCRAALLVLAAAYRRKLNALSWFAVTGSAGKSTTKELLAHVLEKGAGWRVHKAPRSFNNEIGLSLTILSSSCGFRVGHEQAGGNRAFGRRSRAHFGHHHQCRAGTYRRLRLIASDRRRKRRDFGRAFNDWKFSSERR
jgi:UDP-N-acetylmuramyl pentapeptide synthase